MRIAYIAPYQGEELLQQRPTVHNRSLASSKKIELVAEILRHNSNQVEIISQGEVDAYTCRFYPSFSEKKPFHPDIPIHYSSAFPIKFFTGLWEGLSSQRVLRARHSARPFDLILIYNTKRAQLACADYALRRLGVPVILEYEDDSSVSVEGEKVTGRKLKLHTDARETVLEKVSGCIGVSPRLLSQVPVGIPKLLLRGIVDYDIINEIKQCKPRQNWVVFSGTHTKSKGIEQLIKGFGLAKLPDWELHITGHGEMTSSLKTLASATRGVVFHGLVSRRELVSLLCSAKVCVNPHDLSQNPGNVFAFKILEYLAAGAHVITTPMGVLEPEIESGITYLRDNSPDSIATALKHLIQTGGWKHTVAGHVCDAYGPVAVSRALGDMIQEVLRRRKVDV